MRERAVTEYRVISERESRHSEHNFRIDKRYRSKKAVADRIGRLTAAEPWRYYGSQKDRERGPSDLVCCSGYECSCGGQTLSQQTDDLRKELPPLTSVRVQKRQIVYSPWVEETEGMK